MVLPRKWREENVRARQKQARAEYPYLSSEERKKRLLDDLTPQLGTLMHPYADVLYGLSRLTALNEPEKSRQGARLLTQLELVYTGLLSFGSSLAAVELFQPMDYSLIRPSQHSTCCPSPPFLPSFLQFPPAGYFEMKLLSMRIYMHMVLYKPLRSFAPPGAELEIDKHEDAMTCAYQICRRFAGLEYAFEHNPDQLFPCFSLLTMAGFTCHPELRKWVWSKLCHFEQLGQFVFGPVKRNLSVLWSMPDLPTKGFVAWKSNPPEQQQRLLSVDDIDIATKMTQVSLDDESGPELVPDPETVSEQLGL